MPTAKARDRRLLQTVSHKKNLFNKAKLLGENFLQPYYPDPLRVSFYAMLKNMRWWSLTKKFVNHKMLVLVTFMEIFRTLDPDPSRVPLLCLAQNQGID